MDSKKWGYWTAKNWGTGQQKMGVPDSKKIEASAEFRGRSRVAFRSRDSRGFCCPDLFPLLSHRVPTGTAKEKDLDSKKTTKKETRNSAYASNFLLSRGAVFAVRVSSFCCPERQFLLSRNAAFAIRGSVF